VRPAAPAVAYADLIAELSGEAGYFDTDNLISNEASYLHVLPALDTLVAPGGVYLGVGPDQNFSYIAALRPSLAFIVDIRRDNVLQHLFFRALFLRSSTRAEYVTWLFGLTPPDPAEARALSGAGAEAVAAFVRAHPTTPARGAAAVDSVLATVRSLGVRLSERDEEFVRFVHRSFIDAGLDLRFTSHGRRASPFYPSYGELLVERDRSGAQRNYLASEEAFRVVDALQDRGAIVPVVGDLAGPRALPAIAAFLREHGLAVSAFYVSNVEFYLFPAGTFGAYGANVAGLPRNADAVLIRSVFRRPHPETVPGYASTQLLERLDDFVARFEAGTLTSYRALIDGARPPR